MAKIEVTAAHAVKRWDDETLAVHLNSELHWTGRVGYLAWVRDWKAQLKARIMIVWHHRAVMQGADTTPERRSLAQSMRQQARLQCFNLLLVRRAAKQRAAFEREQRIAKEQFGAQAVYDPDVSTAK